MLIKDVMSSNVVSVTPTDSVAHTASLMSKYNIGAIPVVKQNKVCGIVTDRDITLRCVANSSDTTLCKAGDVMTNMTYCVSPQQPLSDALQLMSLEQVRRLPVLENGKLTGMISLADIAKVRKSAELSNALADISM